MLRYSLIFQVGECWLLLADVRVHVGIVGLLEFDLSFFSLELFGT